MLHLHPLLKLHKARHVPIEGDNLSIDNKRTILLSGERGYQLRIFLIQRFSIAGEKRNAVTAAEGEAAHAIVLRLEQPAVPGKWLGGKRRKHRRDPVGLSISHIHTTGTLSTRVSFH